MNINKIKLTILGSGSYQPELNRHSASHLIQIRNQNLVFDFGRGTLDQLMKLGINYYNIDAIFISHTHPDHFSELASFLHIALAEPGIGERRKKDITIYGPKGFRGKMALFYRSLNIEKFRPKYKINIEEIPSGKIIKGKNWQIQGFNTTHSSSLNCLCYRLKHKNTIFAYSGDSSISLGLKKAINNVDLALIEASWPEETAPKTHLTAEQAGKICQESGVKKMVLTHASPMYFKKYNLKKLARKYFKGLIILARDLMKINI
ncbi:MAG: MBL fold metallo-hydrolase [Patescibacteria group bacterium]